MVLQVIKADTIIMCGFFLTKVVSFLYVSLRIYFFSYQTFFLMIYRGNKPERNYQAHAGGKKN